MEAGPEVEAADEEALHDALGFGEGGDHGVGLVRKSEDGGAGRDEGLEDASDEGLGGGVGKEVGVEDEERGDGARGDPAGEEVGDEDAGGEEEGAAGGVEGGAVVGGEVRGKIAGARVRVLGF